MKFSIQTITATIATLFFVASTSAQQQTREQYVERYKHIAVKHMERYGIPASITMAQGILESGNGNSHLAQKSNNHFGIKCKTNWTGRKVYHDDDAKGECFRAYRSVEDSYEDHATFLDSQPRYDSLFAYSTADYKSWARGLKAAGYATAPDYAERLVKIIEDEKLYLLDRDNGEFLYSNRDTKEGDFLAEASVEVHTPLTDQSAKSIGVVDPDSYRVTINPHKGYNIYKTNGVHFIEAKAGDTFESIGEKFHLSPRNLRKFNDIKDKQAQPMQGEVIYFERKKKQWQGNATHHVCRHGETTYAVAQLYGIQQRSVERLNKLKRGDTLTEGDKIKIKK